jgi:hypothetical protein
MVAQFYSVNEFSVRTDINVVQLNELSIPRSLRAAFRDKSTIRAKLLNTIIFCISYIDIPRFVSSQAVWKNEQSILISSLPSLPHDLMNQYVSWERTAIEFWEILVAFDNIINPMTVIKQKNIIDLAAKDLTIFWKVKCFT